MPHWVQVLPQFVLASLILAALPGPTTALYLQRSIRDGRASGLSAVAGSEIAMYCWNLAGGAGLSVLLVANRALNTAMHVIGAAVLIWLGIQAWRGAGEAGEFDTNAAPPSGRTVGAAFRASLLSVAANPKAAVFGLTLLPQFLPSSGPVLPSVLILGGVQIVMDSVVSVAIVLAAVRAGQLLRQARIRQRMERGLGAILVALGIGLAFDAR
ncbi:MULTISPECIES: LysE family translocator [unclassified Nocardia]|uniref:LysE family translocator n=1 Tax=unclassified Nocardia TaxID=2637762 RepID=UPI001CE44F11|nr:MULTISPECIES: LysE family translocator [unclassified Nocardia]